MGGTTSDVALLKDRVPVTSDSGISIGPWKTMVKGVTIDTFALGGDSAVEHDDKNIFLDKRRIVPLSMASAKYPEICGKLKALNGECAIYSYPASQFFLLVNEPSDLKKYTSGEQKLIAALKKGPLMFREAAEAVGISPYVFKTRRLEDEGIIIRCGVTPTDIMHIYGDFTAYDREAAKAGVRYLAFAVGRDFDEICSEIYNLAKERLYRKLTIIFMQYETKGGLSAEDGIALEKLASFIYQQKSCGSRFVAPDFQSDIGFIGIGAPTRIFLPDVAKLFGADADVPEYAEVANAIGAAVGSVAADYSVQIRPDSSSYRLEGGSRVLRFDDYEKAVGAAKEIAEARAREKAQAQGAERIIQVDFEVKEDFYDLTSEDSRLFLEATVTAKAGTK